MLRIRNVSCLAAAVALVSLGCGSSDPGDAPENDAGASIDATHDAGPHADGSAADASNGSDAAAPGSDASESPDGGIVDSAIADAFTGDAIVPSDASNASDAAIGPGVAHCGTIACTGQNKVCCAQYGGNTFGPTSCVATGCANTIDTTMLCAATSDCTAGTVCCLSTSPKSIAQCKQTCGQLDFGQLCDPKADTPGCAAGETCVEETEHLFIAIPAGQGLCQN